MVVLNALTVSYLVSAAKRVGKTLAPTYEALVLQVCGEKWSHVATWLLVVNQFGTLVGFIVVLLDLSVRGATGRSLAAVGCSWATAPASRHLPPALSLALGEATVTQGT